MSYYSVNFETHMNIVKYKLYGHTDYYDANLRCTVVGSLQTRLHNECFQLWIDTLPVHMVIRNALTALFRVP
jgi:hypothetical protein